MEERIKRELEDFVASQMSDENIAKLIGSAGKTKDELMYEAEQITDRQLEKHKQLADELDKRGKQSRHNLANELRLGHYTDFTSPYSTPCLELVRKLERFEDKDLAEKVRMGDYD